MTLVNTSFLKEKNPIVIDCRFDMNQPSLGRQLYNTNHLKGAYYISLDEDMTSEIKSHGGRHPLADLTTFSNKIGSFNITTETDVLIYDDGELPMASRLWFMLKLIGLKNVYVLEGGYDELIKAGFDMTSEYPETVESQLIMAYQENLICDVHDVKEAMLKDQSVIVDSRAKERYQGLEEPLDKIPGHIPTAVNYFWKDSFVDKKLKHLGDIEALFLELQQYDEIILHCGSGITGCVNMLVLNEIGIHSKLYLGSYSDWVSYDDHDIIGKDDIKMKVKA